VALKATLFCNHFDPWPIREGVVHIWRFSPIQDRVDELASVLSPVERERADQLVPEKRATFIAVHAMTRGMLARYLRVHPREIEFRYHLKRPSVVGHKIEFNHARCSDLALLAISRANQLGIDVERVDADSRSRLGGRDILHDAERELAQTPRGFLRVFCRKESGLKATGVGMLDELHRINVVPDQVNFASQLLHVQDLAISPDHVAALATSASCARVTTAERETIDVAC
jgi:4'-phosphopantetheinyl transferase